MRPLKEEFTAPLWLAYKNHIKATLLGDRQADLKDIAYWRSVIFVNMIIYIIPLSIFTLVPSIYSAFMNGKPIVGFADIITFIVLLMLATNRSLTLAQRKLIFILIVYGLSAVLLFFQSWSGPGLMLLLTITVMASIIYASPVAYYAAFINTLICILIWSLLYFGFDLPLRDRIDAASWIAIASNLVFLSFVCAMFLNQLIQGMERSFNDGRKMEANLTAIINSTDAIIFSLDRDLRYISFNKELKERTAQRYNVDIKPGDVVFHLKMTDREDNKFWFDKYTEALAGEVLRFEKDFSVEGNTTTAFFSISPIIRNQEIIGLSCFGLDITDQKKMRLERDGITNDLIARNRNLEQFSFIVSHNLRAPAANIIGFAEVLKYKSLNPVEITKVVEGISVAATNLDGVIKDLNEILQIRAATIENKQYVYFQELVTEISLTINPLLAKEKITLLTDFENAENVASLKSYLYSIFYNLIYNSIKFHFPGRPLIIEIKSMRTDQGIRVTVKDNGLGIDLTKHQEKVFGLYNRFHSHIEGKGAGLFMVKTQVETLGGTITVGSTVDVGTEFIIDFIVS